MMVVVMGIVMAMMKLANIDLILDMLEVKHYLLTVGVINKILYREFLFLTVENHIVTYLRK